MATRGFFGFFCSNLNLSVYKHKATLTDLVGCGTIWFGFKKERFGHRLGFFLFWFGWSNRVTVVYFAPRFHPLFWHGIALLQLHVAVEIELLQKGFIAMQTSISPVSFYQAKKHLLKEGLVLRKCNPSSRHYHYLGDYYTTTIQEDAVIDKWVDLSQIIPGKG